MTEANRENNHSNKQLFLDAKEFIHRNWRWIVIKPVLILYVLQYSITQSITSQVNNVYEQIPYSLIQSRTKRDGSMA